VEDFFKSYQYTIGTIIDALSALFTLFAVGVSLWLAIRKPKEPVLVPINEICKKFQDIGWFEKNSDLTGFDPLLALSDAAGTGACKLFGRKNDFRASLTLIPQDHFLDYTIALPSTKGFIKACIGEAIFDTNYDVKTEKRSPNMLPDNSYVDLHVIGIDEKWIKDTAKKYKGRMKLEEDRRKKMRDEA
jgi:hypothetical protein